MYFLGFCSDLYPIIRLIKIAVGVIQYGVPFILILFVTIDFVRAVIAQKEDEMEKFKTIALKRILYAFAVFLVIAIVKIIMSFLADLEVEDLGGALNSQSWISCWECKNKSECKAKDGDDEEDEKTSGGSSSKGVCCAETKNGTTTYSWVENSTTCPSGKTVDKNRNMTSCKGTAKKSEEDKTKKGTTVYYSDHDDTDSSKGVRCAPSGTEPYEYKGQNYKYICYKDN